tara:strand:+ start:101 stop:352 length:252 start_codon:yes stop_codon:yes gene_type:complete
MAKKEKANEPTINIDGKEIKLTDLDDTQRYWAHQISDLMSEQNKLQYQLDRVKGALFYFQSNLVQSVNKSDTNSEEVKDEVVD